MQASLCMGSFGLQEAGGLFPDFGEESAADRVVSARSIPINQTQFYGREVGQLENADFGGESPVRQTNGETEAVTGSDVLFDQVQRIHLDPRKPINSEFGEGLLEPLADQFFGSERDKRLGDSLSYPEIFRRFNSAVFRHQEDQRQLDNFD